MITRIVLISAGALGLLASGCGGAGAGSDAGTRVIAGFYPLAFAAQEIGGPGIEVTNLTAAGAEPHDLELTPQDLEEILDADLVLYAGEGFQPALEDAVESSGAHGLDVLGGLDLRQEGDRADPHVWLDPVLFAQVVERIGAELGDDTAAAELAARLRALDEDYRGGLADCERRALVTAHDAFGYLAERYGLEVVPIAGLSPEAEPSPQDLEDVVDRVRETGATTVFTEPLLSPEIGETVAREAGVETATLDPLEGLGEDALARGDDYFSVMRANLEALRKGLGCR